MIRIIIFSFAGSIAGLIYGLTLYLLIWKIFGDELNRTQISVGIAHGQLTTFGWAAGMLIGALIGWRKNT